MDLTNVPARSRPGLIAANADKPLAKLGDADKAAQVVLNRYLDGESMAIIAKDLGVSQERIYLLVLEHAEEDWRKAQAGKALTKLGEQEDRLEIATDGVEVGRARELARLHTWRLERVARKHYGQDAPAVQVNINLGDVGARIRVLEGELGLNVAPLQPNSAQSGE